MQALLHVIYFIEAKENLYEEGKKTDKKDGIKVAIVTEENPMKGTKNEPRLAVPSGSR